MVKVLVELNKRENTIVEVYKALHGLDTKEKAIKDIIRKTENRGGRK